ncbi:MAG TPA: DUF5615 family PIN-like protein [Leptolyngbyaceae cyanobacterium]
MARLYADEQFPLVVVELLRSLGHDVLTVREAGNAGLGIPDPEVLAFAVSNDRAVLTLNRFDFIGLHNRQPNHAGIIVCTEDRNLERLARRINDAISAQEDLRGKLIRVNLPSKEE